MGVATGAGAALETGGVLFATHCDPAGQATTAGAHAAVRAGGGASETLQALSKMADTQARSR